MERYLWALSVIQHHKKLVSKVTKELVKRSCITERVKRLVGDNIELGMKIPTIESRASNIPIDKGNCVLSESWIRGYPDSRIISFGRTVGL